MYCIAASVAILLITWEAVLVTGSTGARCPSACCQKIQTVSSRVTALEDAGPSATPSTPANEWELVFSVKAGTGVLVQESWKAADPINANDTNADIFKSPLVEQWGKRPVDQVRIEVKVGNDVKAYFIFDGRGTDKMGFMTEDRLMASTHGKLKGKIWKLGLYSHAIFPFYILGFGAGCTGFDGWLAVMDSGFIDFNPCVYVRRQDRPFFLYCEGEVACKWTDAPIADTFRILLKFA